MDASALSMAQLLLVSCYESGFQPLNLALPLTCMRQRGLQVTTLDLSVQTLQDCTVQDIAGIAISVPMQTAMRLGVAAADALRRRYPQVPICFFGLYAGLNADYLLQSGQADVVLSGEVEEALADWAEGVVRAPGPCTDPAAAKRASSPVLERLQLPVPQRHDLPPLTAYAHLITPDGEVRPAGQVETSRGCLHTCRHCPVVPIYAGRFFVVSLETVQRDMQQQIEAGARHISFGDPDFLNGPGHSLRITEWLHTHYPAVTFDFTAKVEHLCRYPQHVQTFREHGAAFVVSAFESIQADVLRHLAKGHEVADMERLLLFLRKLELPIQPTWIPFTPWTSLQDYLEFLNWIADHGLVNCVPPVQLALRLLIPPRSWLLQQCREEAWLGPLQPDQFTYAWTHPDPVMDELQPELEALVAQLGDDWSHAAIFRQVRAVAYRKAGCPVPEADLGPQLPPPPRLTEDWFC